MAVDVCSWDGEAGREMIGDGDTLCVESRYRFLGLVVNQGWVSICAMDSRFVGSTWRILEIKSLESVDIYISFNAPLIITTGKARIWGEGNG